MKAGQPTVLASAQIIWSATIAPVPNDPGFVAALEIVHGGERQVIATDVSWVHEEKARWSDERF
jgi:hypothetical protein